MRLFLAALAASLLLALAPAGAAAEQARSADGVVESIGVNTHLSWTDNVYADFPRIRHALDRLGVRYIRDGISQGRPDVNGEYRSLAAEGIKLDAVVGDPLGRYGSGPLAQQLSLIERGLGPRVVASIEAPNEYDIGGGPNWLAVLRGYLPRLWRGVHAHRELARIPVIGPSLVDAASRGRLGDIERWTTEGNMHSYPGGDTPDSSSHAESELQLADENTPGQRVQITETGYTNSLHQSGDPNLQLPASERAAGIYMPRLFLDNFRRGITRSYVYELIDDKSDPGLGENGAHFGLLRHDFSPKPAYTSTRNLISILEDPGPAFAPGQLGFELEGGTPALRHVLLQKRDGSFYLALWNADSVWNPVRRQPVEAASTPVTVRFDEPITSGAVFHPDVSASAGAGLPSLQTLTVPIGPEVTIVRIDSRASLLRRFSDLFSPVL